MTALPRWVNDRSRPRFVGPGHGIAAAALLAAVAAEHRPCCPGVQRSAPLLPQPLVNPMDRTHGVPHSAPGQRSAAMRLPPMMNTLPVSGRFPDFTPDYSGGPEPRVPESGRPRQ